MPKKEVRIFSGFGGCLERKRTYKKKSDAKKAAAAHRKRERGNRARVTKEKNGYVLWTFD
jgi:hypothetical protein